MYTGGSQRDKDRLAEAITEDVVNILKVEKKDVIVVFQEASHGNWYASGIRLWTSIQSIQFNVYVACGLILDYAIRV